MKKTIKRILVIGLGIMAVAGSAGATSTASIDNIDKNEVIVYVNEDTQHSDGYFIRIDRNNGNIMIMDEYNGDVQYKKVIK